MIWAVRAVLGVPLWLVAVGIGSLIFRTFASSLTGRLIPVLRSPRAQSSILDDDAPHQFIEAFWSKGRRFSADRSLAAFKTAYRSSERE